jgi:hypothetical protein
LKKLFSSLYEKIEVAISGDVRMKRDTFILLQIARSQLNHISKLIVKKMKKLSIEEEKES